MCFKFLATKPFIIPRKKPDIIYSSAGDYSSENCQWKTPQDIKIRYASASFLTNNKVIFNIKGNNHRLVVAVFYQNGTAVIEWIGTHAEYDKKKFT